MGHPGDTCDTDDRDNAGGATVVMRVEVQALAVEALLVFRRLTSQARESAMSQAVEMM